MCLHIKIGGANNSYGKQIVIISNTISQSPKLNAIKTNYDKQQIVFDEYETEYIITEKVQNNGVKMHSSFSYPHSNLEISDELPNKIYRKKNGGKPLNSSVKSLMKNKLNYD